MSHRPGHKGVSLSDLLKVGSYINRYKRDKSSSKAEEAWNRYNRQVDIYALDGLRAQLRRRDALLAREITTAGRAQALLTRRAALTTTSGSLRRTMELERMAEADSAALWKAYEARAALGVEEKRADLFGRQIAAATDELAAEELTLGRTHSATMAVLRQEATALMVERGVFTEEQAAKLRVLTRMSETLNLEEAQQNLSHAAKLEALGQRIGNLDLHARIVGEDEAVRQQELREDEARAQGAVQAATAARHGGGSFTATEQARIALARQRASTRQADRTRLQLGEIAATRAGAEADRTAARAAHAIAGGRRAVARAEVERDRGGLSRAQRRFEAEAGVRTARLTSAREQEEGRYRTGIAEIRGERSILGSQREVLTAQRAQIGTQRLGVDAAARREREAAQRIGRQAELDYADSLIESAGYTLEAENLGRERDRLAGEREDVQYEREVADWQRNKLGDLPLKGSSRGAVGLLLNIGAELLD